MNYKIIIKGTASTHNLLEDCDGISCHDEFVEYIDNDYDGALKSGYLHFEVEGSDLMSITEYSSDRELTQDELEELASYTQGQWSDGIGEGFEQFPQGEDSDGAEIYISAWHPSQSLEIIQRSYD